MRVREDRRMSRQDEALWFCVASYSLGWCFMANISTQLHDVMCCMHYSTFLMVCPGAQTNFLPVLINRFKFFPHTVELCYQNSLLQTSEELVVVVVGPLTLNAGLLLMVLIRWVCQQRFDSFPSFLSKFIIALGLWTVLDPLAVFIVDSFLGVSHLK